MECYETEREMQESQIVFFYLAKSFSGNANNTNDVHVNHLRTMKVFDSDSVQAHPVATKLL